MYLSTNKGEVFVVKVVIASCIFSSANLASVDVEKSKVIEELLVLRITKLLEEADVTILNGSIVLSSNP